MVLIVWVATILGKMGSASYVDIKKQSNEKHVTLKGLLYLKLKIMNWKEIKEKSGKAFDEWFKWAGWKITQEEFFGDEHLGFVENMFHERELYDFFDENEVIIELGVDYTMEPKYCFKVSVYHGDTTWAFDFWSDLYLTRIEAEEASFKQAFIDLEEKLS
jgi:hypothetical protein